jgi:hypothetical protein
VADYQELELTMFARIKSCGFVISVGCPKERKKYDPYIDEKGWVNNPLFLVRNGDCVQISNDTFVCVNDGNRERVLKLARAVYKIGKNIKNMYILFHKDENGKWILQ